MFHSQEFFDSSISFSFFDSCFEGGYFGQENQKILMKIIILFQNLNTNFSKGKPYSWEMFLNEMRHDFSERFYFSVICSPCSREFEKKVNINSERVNTEVQLIHSCSESIVNDVQWTCTNQQNACVEIFHFQRSIQKLLKSQVDIGTIHTETEYELKLKFNFIHKLKKLF